MPGDTHYHVQDILNVQNVFSSHSVNEYVHTAISSNIQNSLKYFKDGDRFGELQELYDAGELTNVINRVVKDMNHRFALQVLIRYLRSKDFRISAKSLRHGQNGPTPTLDQSDEDDQVDEARITSQFMERPSILNKKDQKIPFIIRPAQTMPHAQTIEYYFQDLDLLIEIPVVLIGKEIKKKSRAVISLPGLRFAQAEALIESLKKGLVFNDLDTYDQEIIVERILSEITGRMLEDLILLETSIAFPALQVFVLQFGLPYQHGEFDMVIWNSKKMSCCIFEIKHSRKIVPEQFRHLQNEEFLQLTEHAYGPILQKFVLYNGDDEIVEEIQYLNIEKFLRTIADPDSPLQKIFPRYSFENRPVFGYS